MDTQDSRFQRDLFNICLTLLGSAILGFVLIVLLNRGHADQIEPPLPQNYPVWQIPDSDSRSPSPDPCIKESRLIPLRMHLMRPDLIAYPFYRGVYC